MSDDEKILKEGSERFNLTPEAFKELRMKYPFLSKYTSLVKRPQREIVGRDEEMRSILAAFNRPELSNVLLLAEAGVGKTALVQKCSVVDMSRIYLEVHLSKMIADSLVDVNQMAEMLRSLFDEVSRYSIHESKEAVLFIDEFHQIVQLSDAAVEVLKPLLADSGTRRIRVVAATTYGEFREYVSSNQPLVERLQRINLSEPNKATTVSILKGMAETYGISHLIPSNYLYEQIYDLANRYIPSSSQPRKSIKLLDDMVGWHRSERRQIDMKLLAHVLYQSEGVNIAFRVDPTSIKQKLDSRVFAQDFATSAIEERLQICIADLNDKTKPMSSFLFTGSTGVGKTEICKVLAEILFEDRSSLIRFDMSEYAGSNSLDRFRIELTNAMWQKPYSILLLDEVEKANSSITRLLLQVLDDGRLVDQNGRVVSFLNAYIIMTTNAGSSVYQRLAQYTDSTDGSEEGIKRFDRLIRTALINSKDGTFPPELLGRVDMIIPFQPLQEETYEKIMKKYLVALKHDLKNKHKVNVAYDAKLIRYIIKDKYNIDTNSGGARGLTTVLEREVTTPISRFINSHPDESKIYLAVEGNLATDNKKQLKSQAFTVVKPVKA